MVLHLFRFIIFKYYATHIRVIYFVLLLEFYLGYTGQYYNEVRDLASISLL